MIESLLTEKEERYQSNGTPHLSFSRINRYLLCPEQYRLYYIEHLRPRIQHASLVFGQITHAALAGLFRSRYDPVTYFETLWDDLREYDLRFKQNESWEKLKDRGQALLEKFLREELPRLGKISGNEKPFKLDITGLAQPLIGVIDLIAELDKKRTVIDFKTSASAYDDHEVVLSDQLTTYQLAEPDAEQVALCVLVKTKEPKIEWHRGQRDATTLTQYLNKVNHVARDISQGRFYKRPGIWCGYCDYLPVCTGDQSKAKETLVQIGPIS
jgi:RecB family exonuclease